MSEPQNEASGRATINLTANVSCAMTGNGSMPSAEHIYPSRIAILLEDHISPTDQFNIDIAPVIAMPTRIFGPDVPHVGELVLAFLATPDRLEAILGDFESGFRRIARTHGEAKARQWYWWQTVRTGAALILPALARMAGIAQLLHRIGIL